MGTKFGHNSPVCPTNKPQPKVIITIVIIKLKLWPAAGCEAKLVAELSSRPLPLIVCPSHAIDSVIRVVWRGWWHSRFVVGCQLRTESSAL